jgi:hypothetical protein
MNIKPDCPECRGTGEYRGLVVVEPCSLCSGCGSDCYYLLGAVRPDYIMACFMGYRIPKDGGQPMSGNYIITKNRAALEKLQAHTFSNGLTMTAPSERRIFEVVKHGPPVTVMGGNISARTQLEGIVGEPLEIVAWVRLKME